MSSQVSLKGVKYNIVPLQPEYVSGVLDIFDRSGKNEMAAALWPSRLSNPDDPTENRRFRSKLLENRLNNQSTVPMIVAVSSDEVQKVLGFAGWSVPDVEELRRVLEIPPKKKEERNVDAIAHVARDDSKADEKNEGDGTMDDGQGGRRGDGRKLPMGLDVGLQRKIQVMVRDAKKELLGDNEKNVLYLGALGTDPDFEGQGIASSLARWGVVRAEEVGVPIYVESSPAAVGLYRRLGFTELKRLKVLGKASDHAMTVFIKHPNDKNPR